MSKQKIIILGKIPPPYYGPAIATEIILNSRLREEFDLVHIDTRLNSSMKTMGKFGWKKIFLTMKIYFCFIRTLLNTEDGLVLVPIGQKTSALIKDSIFILSARMKSKKVLLHLRGSALLTWYESRSVIGRTFFKWIFSRCSGAIVLGNKLKYIFEPFLPAEKLFVIPNGHDYFFPKRSNLDSKFSALYLANLQSGKGIEDVLNAIGLLSESDRNRIILKVVGSWKSNNFEKKCRAIVEEKKLPVTFYNPMIGQSKLQVLADADIFVFPPRSPEGHPWVIIEAMAAGLPVISTDQGAITESVIDGLNGYIVDANNPLQISEKIIHLIHNPDVLKSMGKESRRLYLANFTEERMIEKLASVFKTVLNIN
jgi:glycosyltransferase involved in cell wall biosynthesis